MFVPFQCNTKMSGWQDKVASYVSEGPSGMVWLEVRALKPILQLHNLTQPVSTSTTKKKKVTIILLVNYVYRGKMATAPDAPAIVSLQGNQFEELVTCQTTLKRAKETR